MENIVIVGTGPAGPSAAIYAARADLKPLIIEGSTPGGQLVISPEVENYPGFPQAMSGMELMELFKQAVVAAGTGCMAALDAQKYLESLNHTKQSA